MLLKKCLVLTNVTPVGQLFLLIISDRNVKEFFVHILKCTLDFELV